MKENRDEISSIKEELRRREVEMFNSRKKISQLIKEKKFMEMEVEKIKQF